MLTFVTFKWRHPKGYKTYFNSNHVNVLYKSIQRNITIPFQFVCITDDSRDLTPGIISVPLWESPVLPFEMDERRPNCYRRLRIFSKDIEAHLGLTNVSRLVCLDLDLVITGDITALCSIPGDFVGWNKKYVRYQGAFFMLKPGTRTEVWDQFIKDPAGVRKRAEAAGFWGSDQGAMSILLRPDEKVVGKADGVYHFAGDLRHEPTLPRDCKIAIFHGSWSPWHPDMYNNYAWIREHWTEHLKLDITNQGKLPQTTVLRIPRVQRI